MSDNPVYVPPKVWTWEQPSGGQFASINRPIAGPTHDKALPVGKHPLQLYSLATPNGMKATIMLEELLALGHSGAEYDAWLILITNGDQFSSGFVDITARKRRSGYSSRVPSCFIWRKNSVSFYHGMSRPARRP